MDLLPQSNGRRPAGRRALLAYISAWLLVGGVLAFAAVTLLDGGDTVTLPPVQETELASAAEKAGCELRRGADAERLAQPPVDGLSSHPVAAGFYERMQKSTGLIGALRRGVIVIHYRPELAEEEVEALRTIQEAVPRGTIVVPNRTMRYALAVTAWRRVLACKRTNGGTVDALRLFRGRYVGSGPDTGAG